MRPVRDSNKPKGNSLKAVTFLHPAKAISEWVNTPTSVKARDQRTLFAFVAMLACAFVYMVAFVILAAAHWPIGILFGVGVPAWLMVSWFKHLSEL